MPERFSASSAARHMACHASANLPLAIPNWVEPVRDPLAKNAANKGTDYHKIFEDVSQLPARDIKGIARTLAYIGEVRSQRRFNVMVEAELEANWLNIPTKTRVDLVLYTQDELHVLDPKTGKIPVSPVNNKQLMFYALCVAPLAPKAKGVWLHIVAPWDPNWDESNAAWWCDVATLEAFKAEAIAAQDAINAGSTQFGPSDSCNFCPANPHGRGLKGKPLCPVMMQLLYPQPFDEDEILGL